LKKIVILFQYLKFAQIVIIYVWTKDMIINACTKKCIHMGLSHIFVPGGKKKLRSKKAFIPLAAGS